jgi:hypothetical protein
MSFRGAAAPLALAAVSLLAQSCVEYVPVQGYAPQPQPSPPQYAAAQPPPSEPPPGPPPPAVAAPAAAQGAVDALVAPIALYPDPLVALILPASTAPADISAAAAYLVQYGDMTRLDSQPWDTSVRSLAHYPRVLEWMADNMAWTQALGSAFLSSPSDVMDAVQRMRARALAAGTLASAPQQVVYSSNGIIAIYPAQPGFLYVPAYDDGVVYSDGPYDGYAGPFIGFGEPYPAGDWLSFYFDWGGHRLWSGDRNLWNGHDGWQPPRPGGDRGPPGAHPWKPRPSAPGALPPGGLRSAGAVPQPRLLPGAPRPPPAQSRMPLQQPVQAAPPAPSVPAPRTAAPPPEHPQYAAPRGQPGESAAHEAVASPPAQPAPARAYSQPPARYAAPAQAPRAAPAPAPAPAPSQESGRQEPPK